MMTLTLMKKNYDQGVYVCLFFLSSWAENKNKRVSVVSHQQLFRFILIEWEPPKRALIKDLERKPEQKKTVSMTTVFFFVFLHTVSTINHSRLLPLIRAYYDEIIYDLHTKWLMSVYRSLLSFKSGTREIRKFVYRVKYIIN